MRWRAPAARPPGLAEESPNAHGQVAAAAVLQASMLCGV